MFPRNQLAPRAAYGATIDLDYLRDLARAHEQADFDRVLIANGGGDPIILAAYAAAQTEKLGFMLAHRPALVAPVWAARTYATLDQTTKGRIRLHAVTGYAAEPEYGETEIDKASRYERAGEYLDIVRRTWTSDEPFDYDGKYFQVKNAKSPIRPYQAPHVPISVGGSSDGAYRIAVKYADLYALWAEPLADVATRIATLKSFADIEGVPAPRVSMSVRLIIGATEELAWQKARGIAATLEKNYKVAPRIGRSGGAERLLAVAEKGERHDTALWFGTATAVEGSHDSTSLVGTPDTIIAALLAYYDIGVTTFLSRGYDPLYDAVDYGRYIISAVREEVRKRDQQRAAQGQKEIRRVAAAA
ncbi:LLM class flavin-dependent oxidoreductase [Panacagrimonas perspica]|uniref:LLM class flavin-dependent oxidoreductase n=1 Tax=Panacagrimonas perspica TaxID=381431 RepID=UPI001FE79D69|nr:LLM class flavin-dependent oxidoreductase [Panacagrimonas perspica]